MLTATHLFKSFAHLPAVRNVSLTLAAGQIMALVGASGSGKSTLINLLAGLLDADRGEVRLDGERIAGPKELLVAGHPQIRVVPQEYQLMPNVSIRENISYALRFSEKTYRNARVDELLNRCRLTPVQHRLPRRVSGGEKQRLSIARAIARNPKILILDDCLSAVDTNTENIILNNLRRIMVNRTSVIISHRVSSAKLADKIIVLDNGEIKEQGTHEHLMALGGIYRELYDKQLQTEEV